MNDILLLFKKKKYFINPVNYNFSYKKKIDLNLNRDYSLNVNFVLNFN